MKHLVFIIIIAILFFSCKQEVEVENEVTTNDKVETVEPTDPKETEVWEPIPPTVHPTGQNGVPSDAIVLFDGTNFDEWVNAEDSTAVKWKLDKEQKSMTVVLGKEKTNIQTKRNFGSIQLHIEWKSPTNIVGKDQHRGNSGVFLQSKYEVQILDNNDNTTYSNGQVGSIYKQSVPLAKASVPTGEWNTYDIIYHAPEFDEAGEKTKSATITVLHNGILIQDHYKIKGTTEYIGWPKNTPHGKLPLFLQDHNSDVSYRNIWVRSLD